MSIQLSNHFTYGKLFRFTLPSIIMMVFTSVYGVVDGFFVSNFAGKTSFAAINLIMPFTMILGSLGFMVGTGGTALISKILGEGDGEKANRYFSMMVYFTIVLGILFTVLGILFIKPVAVFLGATTEMLPDCILYGKVVISFTCAFMLQNIFQSFLIAAEKRKLGLAFTVAAGFTNIILDAVFVGVLKTGTFGAALATGISQCVGGILPMIYFSVPNKSLLKLEKAKFEMRTVLKVCGNGSSELMSNISTSVISIVYNFQLLKYIGEDGVSAYGVLMYIQFIFIAVFIGYSIGCAPIISYNYGANNYDEMKNMLKKSVLIMMTSGLVLTVAAFIFSGPLSMLFVGYDEKLYLLTSHAFKLFSFSFLLSGFNIFTSSFFTALNNGAISAAVSFIRTLVFQMLTVLILPSFFEVDGIWIAITISELLAFFVSLFFIFIKRKKYNYI